MHLFSPRNTFWSNISLTLLEKRWKRRRQVEVEISNWPGNREEPLITSLHHTPHPYSWTLENPGWGGHWGEEWGAEVSSSHSFQHYSICEAIVNQSLLCHHGSLIPQIVLCFIISYMNPARNYSKELMQFCWEDSHSWENECAGLWLVCSQRTHCSPPAKYIMAQLSRRFALCSIALLLISGSMDVLLRFVGLCCHSHFRNY